MAGLDLQGLGRREVEFDKIAAGVDENDARASEFFEDETLAAEEAGAEFPDKGDVEPDRRLGEQEAVALDQKGLAGREGEGLDFAGVVAGEADFPARAGRSEVGEEQRGAHQFALDGAQDPVADRVAAHAGFPEDAGGLVDHFAGFGIDLLAGLELDAGDLQVLALDGVIQRLGSLGKRG